MMILMTRLGHARVMYFLDFSIPDVLTFSDVPSLGIVLHTTKVCFDLFQDY